MTLLTKLSILFISALILTACGGSSGGNASSNSSSSSSASSSSGSGGNQAPLANAGENQTSTIGQVVTLDGSASSDPEDQALTYQWQFSSIPNGSNTTLTNANASMPTFMPDLAGIYSLSLVVNDGSVDSESDSISITITDSARFYDDFAGSGELQNYVSNNANSLPDVARADGRYRAQVTDNSNNITLHFNTFQGRLDAQLVSFPFEAIARNIGIGTLADSQSAASASGNPYIFAGLQVHVSDLSDTNSSHVVVGHRGGTHNTIEGKNTVNGSSSVNDAGANIAPNGRADIRIVGNQDRTLTVYWQQPNLTPSETDDNWTLYNGTGNLPNSNPAFGEQVYVGLITYAFELGGLPFVGTCDSLEIIY